jgi:hypothetical protein
MPMAGQDNFVAGFGPPHQLSQLTLGLGDGNPHRLAPEFALYKMDHMMVHVKK